MSDAAAFEVGRNLAITPGSVVFRNQLFELIQYDATTPRVHRRPLLIVPPCINKYYILDLQPENSFVRWAVAQGHTVFVLSWRNIPKELGAVTWDDYIEEAVLTAIEVVKEIAGSRDDQHAGLLRRRHAALLRARRARRAPRPQRRERDAADDDARLRGPGRDRRVRLARAALRARAVADGRAAGPRQRARRRRSRACAPTTSSGTTSSTTTSRARRRRRSTSCTGTAIRRTCRGRCTRTTSRTCTSTTGCASPVR